MRGATWCSVMFLAGLGVLVAAAWIVGIAAGLAATGMACVMVSMLTYRSLQQKEQRPDGP